MADNLVFFESPEITIATNTFINVPTILQYEDTPLIEVVKTADAGFTTQIPIYHPDGTYLAKVVGSRIFTTEDGKKTGLTLKYPKNKTICELDGKTIFEIHRHAAAALQLSAELYTPDGAFLKCSPDLPPSLLVKNSEIPLKISGLTMTGTVFKNLRIGIWIKKDGTIGLGVS